jgi:anhydro-N-acetylmuramic acid kinase
MKALQTMWAIGLMSGTSMDGIDAALIETNGDGITSFGHSTTISYDGSLRDNLRSIMGRKAQNDSETLAITLKLNRLHAEAVNELLLKSNLKAADIGVVGFHGQTVFHDPSRGITCQIGDGAALARDTGISVVNDFRSADLAAGGEGAPLAPVYHVALSRKIERPVAILNIGGVANVTWISPDGGAVAFDTGPGNALIDDWVRMRTNQAMDTGGQLARHGQIDQSVLQELLKSPYFDRAYPKSLDRDAFSFGSLSGLSLEDGAATLSAFTAYAVLKAAKQLPAPPLRWLVCGGGRHNRVLMANLRTALDALVEPVEAVGWQGDDMEAQAFAFLAVRSLYGLPISYPQTTGVKKPTAGGVLHQPGNA